MTFFEELAEEKVVINPNKLNLWEPSCTQIDLQVQSPRFGVFWGILGHFGVFWAILGYFGPFAKKVGYFGPLPFFFFFFFFLIL